METTKLKINKTTGLTPTQERACTLLAGGENPLSVAEQLDITEDILHLWQKQPTFRCYYNRQREHVKNTALNCLFGLLNEAVDTIRDCMKETSNEATRLKAATYIIDKLQNIEVGETDILAVVRREATYTDDWLTNTFHEEEYTEALSELGVEEQDYKLTLK